MTAPTWTLVEQGPATGSRLLVQGPGYQWVVISSAIPADIRVRLGVAILRELEEIETDRREATLDTVTDGNASAGGSCAAPASNA